MASEINIVKICIVCPEQTESDQRAYLDFIAEGLMHFLQRER